MTKAGAARLGDSVGSVCGSVADIVVVGAVVCTREGVRLGKGRGFAELEWGMLWEMGVVNDETLVATTVHDSQIVSSLDLPVSSMMRYDLPVDIICTPAR